MVTTEKLGLTINAAFVKEAKAAYVYYYPTSDMIFIQGYSSENEHFKNHNVVGVWRPVKSVTIDDIQKEREKLCKTYGDTKDQQILSKHIQLRKRQQRLVSKLPPVPVELEEKAITGFYSDPNFKIKD